ncbi:MAG: carboxypeptidase-like regulatory domain-containing protein, partial [Saprospiraceae bacterium]|nr:carboxypeptidase-like regulatory domain-containing protein [Saprospiraceae bacterium]
MKKSPLLLLFLAVCFTPLLAQQTVGGLVTSSDDGQPLIGVTITVKGTTSGTVTDLDGRYSIDVAPEGILVFSYTGFTSQEITVGSQ